jgi:hypothetical protein
MSLGPKTLKMDPMTSVSPKMSLGAQNMKTVPDALVTAENHYGSAKQEKWTSTSVPPKMSPGAQNMKTGPDALGTAKNMPDCEKQENGIGHTRFRRKRVRERKT